MHPYLTIGVFDLKVPMYGLMLTISILIGHFFARRQMVRKLALAEHRVDLVILMIAMSALLGARLFALVFEMNVPFSRIPALLFRPQASGVTFYGGFLAALAALSFLIHLYRIDFWEVADILSVPTAFGLGLTRIGCFLAGCCWGIPTRLPWAATFTDPEALTPMKHVPLHPVQLYHSVANFAVFGVIGIAYFKWPSRPRGMVFLLFITFYGMGRFFTEFFRGDAYRGIWWGGISTGQLISVGLFLFGLFGICLTLSHRPDP